MDKNGNASKLVYSNAQEGVSTTIQLQSYSKNERIGIYTSFHKVSRWNNGSATNKNCPNYLGVTIAEQLLAKVFKNVERMPNNNRGFDFICNKGYMIDVKSASKRKNRNSWSFVIKQNQIADYFLCLAFDNRQKLNPMHIWLIPSKEINNLKSFEISIAKLDKWSKYELTDKLDKVIECCNIMKET